MTAEPSQALLIKVNRLPEGADEALVSGTLWLEEGRIAVQGVQESTAAVIKLLPERVPSEDGVPVGPEAGEDYLWGLCGALQGPTVFADPEFPHADAFEDK